jgi:sugar O-acyltransferase (sialic acid O-acetyltransferase NeuD family)
LNTRLLIIGAGGFGREVLAWARDVAAAAGAQAPWTIAGFLDANPRALDGLDVGVPIIGDARAYLPAADDRLICAIGDPSIKLRVCRELEARGARFATIIHPSALIGPHCTIGAGTIFCPRSVCTCDATIGKHVAVNILASIGHDAVVGDGCTLNGHSDVTGHAELGEGVFLGSHAVVMPGGKVGDYARIGAGSVVLRKAPPQTSVMGVPAKRIWSAA